MLFTAHRLAAILLLFFNKILFLHIWFFNAIFFPADPNLHPGVWCLIFNVFCSSYFVSSAFRSGNDVFTMAWMWIFLFLYLLGFFFVPLVTEFDFYSGRQWWRFCFVLFFGEILWLCVRPTQSWHLNCMCWFWRQFQFQQWKFEWMNIIYIYTGTLLHLTIPLHSFLFSMASWTIEIFF